MENQTPSKDDLYRKFQTTCTDEFHLTAHHWQATVGAILLEAAVLENDIRHLCVRPTGGGKSLVFNVVALLLGDVTICICPLLSLGADQTKKTLALIDSPSPAPITAFHLDEMKLKSVYKLKSKLRDERNRDTAVVIYMSPRSLSTAKGKSLVPFLIRNDFIRLIVIDEIHLATSFGNTFRKEFGNLPDILFKHIKCPMLFLTATCTDNIRHHFQRLMQLDINSLTWPSANEMAHRSVSIDTKYTTKPFQYVTKTFKAMISDSDGNLPSKVIVYSNTRERIITFAENIRKRMNSDVDMKDIDVITLIGTLTKEEKARLIRIFVNGSQQHPDLKIRLLCATSGVGNAGIDCPDVRAVYRIDFPPSILDMAQEKGRAGRRPGASADDFHYILCYSLETYLYLFKRILEPADEHVNESFRRTQISDLLQVAKVLITPNTCIPHSLENLMGHPESDEVHDMPFCGACTNCTQKKSEFEHISREGITGILLDLFISSSEELVFTLDNTVSYIMKYNDSQDLIFRTHRAKYEPLRIKKVLFQLITFEILTVVYSSRLNKMLFQLARSGNNVFDISINSDEVWDNIPTTITADNSDDDGDEFSM